MKAESTWTIYRSRFVVRALRCIRPQAQFESIYVPLQESPNPTSRAGFKQVRMSDVLTPQTLPTRLPLPLWTG